MTTLSSIIVTKRYVLEKVYDILTSDTTLAGVINHSEIGLDPIDMLNLPEPLYPNFTVTVGTADNEQEDGFNTGVMVNQNLSILYGAIQPTGSAMLTGNTIPYEIESMIKAALDDDPYHTLSSTLVSGYTYNLDGVIDDNYWARIERFYFGPTTMLTYDSKSKRVLSEIQFVAEYEERETRNSRYRFLEWSDSGPV